MKKFIAMLVALMLCVPCALAEDMGTELTHVTLLVKQALDIGDEFTDFTSSNYDNRWELYWYGGSEEVSVSCDSNGCINNYYYYNYNYIYDGDYSPRYPDLDEAALAGIAEEFLAKVITGEGDGWLMDDITSGIVNGNTSRVTVSGRLTKQGLPTDITFNLTIDSGSGKVVSYYRSDNYMKYSDFTGDMTAVITAEDAEALLKPNTYVELVYLVTDPAEMAHLVYTRINSNHYVVRASDGALIDISNNYGYDSASAETVYGKGADAGENRELTEAELKGISAYENAMSAADIDAMLRAMPELGLTDEYILVRSDYFDNGTLKVEMSYTRELTDAEKAERNLDANETYKDEKSYSVSAADGKIANIYTYYPGNRSTEVEADIDGAADTAQAFIGKYYPEYADQLILNRSDVNAYTYSWERNVSVNYCRTHNGYPFRANYVNVTVNSENGTIDGLYMNWSDTQEFDEPAADTIISEEKAHEIYLEGLEFENAFLSVPGEKVSDWEYVYDLSFAWHYRDVEHVYAVDAVTGETYSYQTASGAYEYGDISGHAREVEIAKLALYGIGFSGGEFLPDEVFTARDALIFINQTPDYSDSPLVEARDYESLKLGAHDMGATGLEVYEEHYVLSRYDFVNVLLGMAGYDKAMKLTGIYACGFADDADILTEDYPVIAIAYGLGLISCDADGNINAYEPLTRAEGAAIFHNLLSIK